MLDSDESCFVGGASLGTTTTTPFWVVPPLAVDCLRHWVEEQEICQGVGPLLMKWINLSRLLALHCLDSPLWKQSLYCVVDPNMSLNSHHSNNHTSLSQPVYLCYITVMS